VRFLTYLPLLLALLLVSCLEGEEEVWLERDGSGRLEATYKMPPLVFSRFGTPDTLVKTLKDAAARDPHVNFSHVAHRTDKGQAILELVGTFDDLRELASFPQRQLRDPKEPDKPVKLEALFGDIHLDLSAGRFSFQRSVDLSSILPNTIKKAPGILDQSAFHYTLHLPAAVSDTNATTRSEEHQKLEWRFLLKEYVDKPMKLTAEGRIPRPSNLWFLGLLPLAILIAIFLFRTKRSLTELETSVAGP
jgi:hypothetical protein